MLRVSSFHGAGGPGWRMPFSRRTASPLARNGMNASVSPYGPAVSTPTTPSTSTTARRNTPSLPMSRPYPLKRPSPERMPRLRCST